MAFDFSAPVAPDLETALRIVSSKATAADKRRAVLAAYDATAASDAATLADWRNVAHMLAGLLPKAKAEPLPETLAPSGLEWCSYTDTQAKGNATAFYGQRWATFRFADGNLITVSMRHKKSLPLPDWDRAARCAVSFYKARRARNFLSLVGGTYGCQGPSLEEEYADGCAVPEIVTAQDLSRDTWADPAQCNAATAAMREGPRYLSELVAAACAFGGDWQAAWQGDRRSIFDPNNRALWGERAKLLHALDRDSKARADAALSPDLEAATNEAAERQAGIAAAMELAHQTGNVFRLITAPDWCAVVADMQAAA